MFTNYMPSTILSARGSREELKKGYNFVTIAIIKVFLHGSVDSGSVHYQQEIWFALFYQ